MDVDTAGQTQWIKITNLAPQVSDKGLAAHIQQHGKETPKFLEIYPNSKGERPFAFVQMKTLQDAETVIKGLRATKLKGNKLKIQKCGEKSHPRFEILKGATRKVLLCNLPVGIDKEEVMRMCSGHGTVKKVWFNVNEQGYQLRTALVTMASREEASSVFDKLHQKKVKGCIITTRYPATPLSSEDSMTIKMSNLSRKVTEQHILNHFKQHSKIKKPPISISLRHHPSNEDMLGFAVIEMQSHEDALKVVQNVDGTELRGTKCAVKLGYSPLHKRQESQRGQTRKVILGNLHYKMGIAETLKLCKEYGKVKSVDVNTNKEGYPTCAAFVEMANAEEAARLFDGLHGKKVNNLVIRTKFMSQNPGVKGRARPKRAGGLKKVTAKKKLKGSAFSGKKKMEKLAAAFSRMASVKGKGKGKGRKKKNGVKRN